MATLAITNQRKKSRYISDTLKYIAALSLAFILWFVVFLGESGWKEYNSVAIVTLALFIGIRSKAAIPFSVFSLMYVVLFFSGQLLISTKLVELPWNYSEMIRYAHYEFSVYFLAASIGFLAFDKFVRQTDSKVIIPYPSVPLLTIGWTAIVILVFFSKGIHHPVLSIMTKVALPVLGFALLWSVNSKLLKVLVLVVTIFPVISSRHIAGQFLVWAMIMYFVLNPYAEASVQRVLKYLIISLLIGFSIFTIGTATKYDLKKMFDLHHYVTRLFIVQSHSTARLVEIRHDKQEDGAALYGGGAGYWLSLIPGISKPVNAGDVTYTLSRKSINKTDLPYLPPGTPGELFVTIGWMGLMIGGFLHGGLISMLWFFAYKLRDTRIYVSLFVGATVFLCGIGTASFYARLNSVKESFAVLLLFIVIMVLASGGRFIRRVPG